MRIPRDDDELVDLLGGRSMSSDPAKAAEYCRALLAGGGWPADVNRASLLVYLGEYSQLAGDIAGAGTAFREAVADESATVPDERAQLASWCFEHGDRDEGEQLLQTVRAERPRDPETYEFVGELYEELGDLAQATRWYTAGGMRAIREDADAWQIQSLMMARRRVRLAQGLPEDDYDIEAREIHDEMYPDSPPLS